ncbi:MlaD family protein [Mucilaginibacter sp. X4EP1]|uniref:MlaD family protein n=1 Tax=Mucilaginibacter sp. X4EP1 TaxID=2723092 RepID=UPI00216AA57A|nr:MlaD family protein [Mucilaginibacter sp. X4EP1]MCS3812129.1 phospholipid/cholesterol/gamma-HCH transport system substrate-binding protein [Mucilaginibacter sp. X4EP1]
MAKQGENNIKLGVFVLTGLLVVMVAFYMIGSNTSMFGSSFKLKARFSNLSGLMEGNNVLFSGIQAGTVKSIEIINDTTIEVTMVINSKVSAYIHNNAEAAIGTDGLMGNKVINIQPEKINSPLAKDGDLLPAQKLTSMDAMLQTLSKTNNNIATISEALKTTVLRLDTSEIFKVLNDKTIGISIRASLKSINNASDNASEMTGGFNDIVGQIKRGKGAAGVLLTDTGFAGNLKTAMVKLRSASDNANKMTLQLNHDLAYGKGPLHALLRDSSISQRLNTSMENVQKGTDGFNQIVTALKHNFLVRGYFKTQEKKRLKDSVNRQAVK